MSLRELKIDPLLNLLLSSLDQISCSLLDPYRVKKKQVKKCARANKSWLFR